MLLCTVRVSAVTVAANSIPESVDSVSAVVAVLAIVQGSPHIQCSSCILPVGLEQYAELCMLANTSDQHQMLYCHSNAWTNQRQSCT